MSSEQFPITETRADVHDDEVHVEQARMMFARVYDTIQIEKKNIPGELANAVTSVCVDAGHIHDIDRMVAALRELRAIIMNLPKNDRPRFLKDANHRINDLLRERQDGMPPKIQKVIGEVRIKANAPNHEDEWLDTDEPEGDPEEDQSDNRFREVSITCHKCGYTYTVRIDANDINEEIRTRNNPFIPGWIYECPKEHCDGETHITPGDFRAIPYNGTVVPTPLDDDGEPSNEEHLGGIFPNTPEMSENDEPVESRDRVNVPVLDSTKGTLESFARVILNQMERRERLTEAEQTSVDEHRRLAEYVLREWQDKPGRGDPRNGEGAVDVAIGIMGAYKGVIEHVKQNNPIDYMTMMLMPQHCSPDVLLKATINMHKHLMTKFDARFPDEWERGYKRLAEYLSSEFHEYGAEVPTPGDIAIEILKEYREILDTQADGTEAGVQTVRATDNGRTPLMQGDPTCGMCQGVGLVGADGEACRCVRNRTAPITEIDWMRFVIQRARDAVREQDSDAYYLLVNALKQYDDYREERSPTLEVIGEDEHKSIKVPKKPFTVYDPEDDPERGGDKGRRFPLEDLKSGKHVPNGMLIDARCPFCMGRGWIEVNKKQGRLCACVIANLDGSSVLHKNPDSEGGDMQSVSGEGMTAQGVTGVLGPGDEPEPACELCHGRGIIGANTSSPSKCPCVKPAPGTEEGTKQ